MKIVIAGPKGSGKTTIGQQLAERFDIPFLETDTIIEQLYAQANNESLSFREIFRKIGKNQFRQLERQAVKSVAASDWCIISAGGSTLLDPDSRRLLRQNGILIYLKADPIQLYNRLVNSGATVYRGRPINKQDFLQRMQTNIEIIEPFANILIDTSNLTAEQVLDATVQRLLEEFAMLSTAPNTLGQIIRLTTFGESHGPALGAILDGVPPGLPLSPEDIQCEMDRRRPGQSSVSTARNEADQVRILSGVFEGKTTGAAIGLIIENKDQDSSKYDNLKDLFRPGHADFTFWKKFGIRDHRGGGRSSGRETAARVAGGAVAKKALTAKGVTITAHALEIAGVHAVNIDFTQIEHNTVRCADEKMAPLMEQAILEAKKHGDSVGGIVQLEIKGLPAGLGDPVFGKLDARLAAAILSLGAVKGIEFGDGFAGAQMLASQFNDSMKDGQFLSNHAGGVLGGISSGADVILRFAVRPTPSISIEQHTCDIHGQDRNIQIEGRHDPCIVPRIIPVAEAMAALVVLDLWQIQTQLNPIWP